MSAINRSGVRFKIFDGRATVKNEKGTKVLTGKLVDKDLYEVVLSCKTVSTNIMTIEENLCHRRYEHLNMEYIRETEKNKITDVLDWSSPQDGCNEACVRGKGSRSPFNEAGERVTGLLDFVYSNVCGSITLTSNKGNRYSVKFWSFILW